MKILFAVFIGILLAVFDLTLPHKWCLAAFYFTGGFSMIYYRSRP